MNLSRSTRERGMPSISFIRWSIIILGFLVFVAVSLVLYIRSADSGYRSSESTAIRIAKNQADLAEISEVDLHTWEDTVWVVTGKDAAGETWMVWELKDRIVKLKVKDYLSEKQIIGKFSADHNGKTSIRVLPGWFQGKPIWEIRYWDDESVKQYQSIDFYSFEDGTQLKTYRLSS
jgi:uncharacterized protein YpmB